MDVEQGGKILLLVVVIGIVIVIALGVSTTQQIGSQAQIENQAGYVSSTAQSASNAINDVATNVLVISTTGSNAFLTVATPVVVTVTGNGIISYATNTVYAVANVLQTYSFTINSPSGLTTSTSFGNFYNITTITLSGFSTSAYPTFNVIVTQTFSSVNHGSPAAYATNSLSSFGRITYNYQGSINNFTTNQNNLANTQGSNANYAYYILFAALIIAIVIGALIKYASERGK